MFQLLLLIVALYHSGRGAILIEHVEIVSQLNASLDERDRLVSQKFTDILPQVPLLAGADDFMLPANISDNITILQLSFSIVRQYRDSDPDTITVSLMYNDAKIEGPGQVFFTKSVRAPNNPPRWYNDSLGQIEVITLNITQNEQSSTDPTVYFDFTNIVWLPRQTRLWLTMYVTGTRSYETTPPYAENVLFWCMTTTAAAAAAPNSSNAPYFFRDSDNIMGRGFINWTNASMVERALNFNSPSSQNMAWSVALLGVAPSTFLEMLQGMDTKKVIAISVCSLIGILFVCGCVLCICKRCRRCKRKSTSIEFIDLSSPPLYPPPKLDESVTYSEVSLDGGGGGNGAIHTLKSTPSGRYLENATHIPIRTRTTTESKKTYDKDK